MTDTAPHKDEAHQRAFEAFIKPLNDAGMDIRCPWECSLDDTERERYEAALTSFAVALSASPSRGEVLEEAAKIAETLYDKASDQRVVVAGFNIAKKIRALIPQGGSEAVTDEYVTSKAWVWRMAAMLRFLREYLDDHPSWIADIDALLMGPTSEEAAAITAALAHRRG